MKDELENLFKKAAEKEEGNFKEEFWETYQTGLAKGSFVSKTFGLSKIAWLTIFGSGVLLISVLSYFAMEGESSFVTNPSLAQENSVFSEVQMGDDKQVDQINSVSDADGFGTEEKKISDKNELSTTNVSLSNDKSSKIDNAKVDFIQTPNNESKKRLKVANKTKFNKPNFISENLTNKRNKSSELSTTNSSYSAIKSKTIAEEGNMKNSNDAKQVNNLLADNVKNQDNENELGEIANKNTRSESLIVMNSDVSEEKKSETGKSNNDRDELSTIKEERIASEEVNNQQAKGNNKNHDIKKKRKFWFGGYRKDNPKDNSFQKLRMNAKFGISSYSAESVLILPNGYNFELNLEYRFNSKLSVSQGVGFLSQGVQPHTHPYSFRIIENPESSQVFYEKFYDLRRFQFLDFPLSINWSITEKHRISSGMILDVMVGSNYTLTITDNTPVSGQYGNRISKEKIKNTFLNDAFFRNSFSFQLSYQYNFNRSGLQLMYVHGISPIMFENGISPIMRSASYTPGQNPKRLQLSWTYKLF